MVGHKYIPNKKEQDTLRFRVEGNQNVSTGFLRLVKLCISDNKMSEKSVKTVQMFLLEKKHFLQLCIHLL